MSRTTHFVSLVLATYGRCDDVGRCLQSLAQQTCRDFEVLVVDQNADERIVPLVDAAREQGLTIRYLRQAEPNLSAARNFGIREAKGGIIGFPDDDCWYEPETLAVLLQTFAAGADGAVANWVEQSEARGGAPAGELSLHAWRNFRGGDASSISLFFHRALFERLGGFDERFGVGRWYGAAEETDFILRALTGGARLLCCPAARVHHRFGVAPVGSMLDICRAQRKRARGTGAIYAKHRLPGWVIVRGVLAPWLSPLLRLRVDETLRGVYVTLGRLEGFGRWLWKDKI